MLKGTILAVGVCAVLVLSGSAAADAAHPPPGTYSGSATVGRFATVKLKVSPSGKRVNFRGPHEYCGVFNPLPPYFGRIDRLRISSAGKFEGERDYTLRRTGARAGAGRVLDLVLDWSISVTGRFVSPERANCKVTYRLRHHLEYSGTHERWDPPGAPGDEKDCGKHSGRWQATR
jgi:hypothetical protein